MSEVICESCGDEGDFAPRMICEARLASAASRAECCIKNSKDNINLIAANKLWEEKCLRLEKENEQAIKFLTEALPEIECVNHFQNGLITAIGTFLQALKENDDE